MGEAPKKCIEAGANDYVPKPYDIKDLRVKIEKWISADHIITNKYEEAMAVKKENRNQPLIDLEYLNQLSEGDDDFTISMLSYFLDNTPTVFREMKQFYDEKDWKNLRNVAHKFKPQLTFMGIKSIFNEVETIEQAAASVTNTGNIPGLIEISEKVSIAAMDEIKHELEKLLDKNQD